MVERNFDKVENLHIGNVYQVSSGLENPLTTPEQSSKFQTNITVIHITEPKKESPIEDDERQEYEDYLAKMRSHKSYRKRL